MILDSFFFFFNGEHFLEEICAQAEAGRPGGEQLTVPTGGFGASSLLHERFGRR